MSANTSVTGDPTPQQMRLVILSSTLGTAIEWYDFFVYGTVAVLVFPQIFFPSSNAFIGTLLALLTFLFGFLARPFGGALFGHLGDRVGRKSTLVATLLLMGIATFVIGILPGYSTLGIVAVLLLIVLRLCQGLGVGGEWGGSVLLAMEYGYKRNRGFWASWPQLGAPLGLALSTVIVAIVQASQSASTFLAWGWRVPFLVSALLIIVGLYIRLRVMETPLFVQIKEQKREAKSPIIEAFRHNTKEILLSAGSRFVEQAPFYLFAVFAIAYGKTQHLNGTMVLTSITIAAVIEMFTIPLFGAFSDRFGRRRWYLIGCVLMILFAFPYFLLLNSGVTALVVLGIIISLPVFHGWVYGPQAAMIAENFRTSSRYSGASLGYQLAAPFAGGLAPIIALLLLNGKTSLADLGLGSVSISIGGNGSWQAVAIYIIVLALISFFSVLALKDLTHADITGEEGLTITDGALAPAGDD